MQEFSEIMDAIADENDTQVFNTEVKIDAKNPTTLEVLAEIEANHGKISYSRFMHLCLYGKNGYYSTGKVKIAQEGERHFLTSPETGPIFGACIGKILMQVWESMGSPVPFNIIEMGGGEGGLASSLLEWTQKLYPEFYEALRYTILEHGHDLIPVQKRRLQSEKVRWVQGSAFSLPFSKIQGAFISNELVDAFPIEVVRNIGGRLKQKYISFNENQEWIEVWEDPQPEVERYITEFNVSIEEGSETAINLYAPAFQTQLDAALDKGAILTIDYEKTLNTAATRFFGPGHLPLYDPFKKKALFYEHMGEIDITSDVPFDVLLRVAEQDGLTTDFYGTQAAFLSEKTGKEQVITDMLRVSKPTWREMYERYPEDKSYSLFETGKLTAFEDFSVLFQLKNVNSQATKKEYSPLYKRALRGFPFRIAPPGTHCFSIQIAQQNTMQKPPPSYQSNHWNAWLNKVFRDGVVKNYNNLALSSFYSIQEGTYWTFPYNLIHHRIYNYHGNLLWDLTREEELKRLVEESGYLWEK